MQIKCFIFKNQFKLLIAYIITKSDININIFVNNDIII